MVNWEHNKLWAAVLVQAIIDSKRDCGFNKSHKKNRSSAIFWMYKSKNTGTGSLPWICEMLGLSVDFVREYVREWNGIRFDTFNYLK